MKHSVSLTLWALLCLLGPNASRAFELPPLKVPADPYASYEVIDINQRSDGMIEIVTKRTGKSGTSYSKRLVNCQNQTAKYLGDGDTLEQMEKSKASPRMGPLVEGSSTHAAAMYACSYGPSWK